MEVLTNPLLTFAAVAAGKAAVSPFDATVPSAKTNSTKSLVLIKPLGKGEYSTTGQGEIEENLDISADLFLRRAKAERRSVSGCERLHRWTEEVEAACLVLKGWKAQIYRAELDQLKKWEKRNKTSAAPLKKASALSGTITTATRKYN
ncbi:hypothetical protein AV530_018312 [Patagioenas fasciata monilis]|uniref:Uncharacterized protein n=1 Tax=Patagioenas fasciata monilis TaxID=372326 RepID=A0A1V4JRG5_PATFA|nr:hypothetical protein AV530_018312 [Patagioenas fasciata monilis]